MKKNRNRRLKIPSAVRQILLILVGFGAGFTANHFVEPLQPPLIKQEPHQNSVYPNQKTISVCFTPGKQCQTLVINQINIARQSIYIQAYSFTDREISQALVNAFKRGVNVKVLLDKSNKNDHRSAKDIILSNSIPLRFDHPAGIAHNKIMVIDEATIITGSYNFSEAAYKRNTENLLVISNVHLAKEYINNWIKRWEAAKER